MSSSIAMKTAGTVTRTHASQTKNATSSQTSPILPPHSSPVDVTFTIPSFAVDSVEQAVSPAFAAQSYRMCSIETEINNRRAFELGLSYPVGAILTIPSFDVDSVEQAVSPAFAVQSYRMCSNKEAFEPGPNSPVDITLTIPPFIAASVEQAVSPVFAAQSYQMRSIEVEIGSKEAYELGPRSGKL